MLILLIFINLVLVPTAKGSCSPNEMTDAIQKCLQYQSLNTYWQFPFGPQSTYTSLCSNSTCLTYCYGLVALPCNGTYNTEHFGDGRPIKAAYLGFCDKNRTEVEAALTCSNNVNNQDVLDAVSAFQTTVQGYADTFVTNGTAVCLDMRSLLDTLIPLMNAQCSSDSDALTMWQTFFNTLYAACDASLTPSYYTKYKDTPVSQCADADFVTSHFVVYVISVLCVIFVKIR